MVQTPDSIQVKVKPMISLGQMEVDGELLTPAETVGLVMASIVQDLEDARDTARRFAMSLLEELTETERHLTLCLGVLTELGTTFAAHGIVVEEAKAFLDRDRVPADDQEPATLDAPEPS
jgi:hypothetical protein